MSPFLEQQLPWPQNLFGSGGSPAAGWTPGLRGPGAPDPGPRARGQPLRARQHAGLSPCGLPGRRGRRPRLGGPRRSPGVGRVPGWAAGPARLAPVFLHNYSSTGKEKPRSCPPLVSNCQRPQKKQASHSPKGSPFQQSPSQQGGGPGPRSPPLALPAAPPAVTPAAPRTPPGLPSPAGCWPLPHSPLPTRLRRPRPARPARGRSGRDVPAARARLAALPGAAARNQRAGALRHGPAGSEAGPEPPAQCSPRLSRSIAPRRSPRPRVPAPRTGSARPACGQRPPLAVLRSSFPCPSILCPLCRGAGLCPRTRRQGAWSPRPSET